MKTVLMFKTHIGSVNERFLKFLIKREIPIKIYGTFYKIYK